MTTADQMESHSASRLERLATGDIKLTAQEKVEFATFMAITMTRTPFFREALNGLAVAVQLLAMKRVLDEPEAIEQLLAKAETMFGDKMPGTTPRSSPWGIQALLQRMNFPAQG